MADLKLEPAVDFELLVLIGGGEFSFGDTREVDEYLIARLGEKRTVAFLPTASGSAEYANHFGKYLAKIDGSVETTNVPVYRGRDNRRQKSLAMIESAALLYVGGGVAERFLATIKDSPAEESIRKAATGGTIVAAIGASASAFGVTTWDLSAGMSAGLGWLASTVIVPGFEPGDDSTLRRLMSIPGVTLGLGIPPGTALVVERDGSTKIVGGGSVAAFRKR